jgi:hypothetical protein
MAAGMSNGLYVAYNVPTKRTEETSHIEGNRCDGPGCGNGRDDAGGVAQPPAAINDVVVQIHASGFVPTELT